MAQLRKERNENIYVATKPGRRLDPHVAGGYNQENLTAFIECSLKNLNAEAIDLLQLHCPPTNVFYMPVTFDLLDDLVRAGELRYCGVSVTKVEEAPKAIEFPNVQTVQIVFSMFRQLPSELFFGEAVRRKVGILARVPLASGLLTGKLTSESSFESDDHRAFNRHGESFDRAETFSGVDYETGLRAIDELRSLIPAGWSMPQFGLRCILMFEAVSCAIPGAKTPAQAEDNILAADLPALDAAAVGCVGNGKRPRDL